MFPQSFARHGRRQKSWLCLPGVLAVLLAPWLDLACSLDERSLSTSVSSASTAGEETGGSSNTPSGGRAGAGVLPAAGSDVGGQSDAGSAGSGFESGGAGAPTFEPGCADLNHDRVSDCTQTRLENAGFTSDVQNWTAEVGASVAWDAGDLLGATGSGSALVTSQGALDVDGYVTSAVAQCISVAPGQLLEVFANASIDGDPSVGSPAIMLWFFPTDGCPGTDTTDVYVLPSVTLERGKAATLTGATQVPDYMTSARVRLGVQRPFRTESFSVRFDNVLVLAH